MAVKCQIIEYMDPTHEVIYESKECNEEEFMNEMVFQANDKKKDDQNLVSQMIAHMVNLGLQGFAYIGDVRFSIEYVEE